ncbi:hypothetical protein ACPPVT_16335 [Angustibacter sp. McL0619]|uniref:hypothetical protein n=1 Tax=Angustibacter sp. McL0619 TaxID=3415676 RepID=UPI003CF8530E
MTTRTATRKTLIVAVLTVAVLAAPVSMPAAQARIAPPDTSPQAAASSQLAHTQSALEAFYQDQQNLQHSRLANIAAEMNRQDARDWPVPQTAVASGTTCP